MGEDSRVVKVPVQRFRLRIIGGYTGEPCHPLLRGPRSCPECPCTFVLSRAPAQSARGCCIETSSVFPEFFLLFLNVIQQYRSYSRGFSPVPAAYIAEEAFL